MAYPKSIMRSVLWSFNGERFSDVKAFDAELVQYSIDIQGENRWEPDAVVLDSPTVEVLYEYWDLSGEEDREVEATLELSAANGKAFTALDLLFQLHNATVENLRGMDHCFFEGLSLDSDSDKPRYFMYLGS